MIGSNTNSRDLSSEDLQRFAELGRLSASLLHEISNPLSVALLHLDQLGDQTSEGIKHVRRNLIRLTQYVNAARGQISSSASNSFYIGRQISDIKCLTIPIAKASYVKLKINKPPKARIQGDPLQFQQILINLIINAVEAYPKTDRLDKTRLVSVEFYLNADSLIINVRDNGSGVSDLNKVFEPFYTTKSDHSKGLGLGLVIVKNYVEQSFRGHISVSNLEHGACFSIKVPLM